MRTDWLIPISAGESSLSLTLNISPSQWSPTIHITHSTDITAVQTLQTTPTPIYTLRHSLRHNKCSQVFHPSRNLPSLSGDGIRDILRRTYPGADTKVWSVRKLKFMLILFNFIIYNFPMIYGKSRDRTLGWLASGQACTSQLLSDGNWCALRRELGRTGPLEDHHSELVIHPLLPLPCQSSLASLSP